jgi:transcriptional regulator CtsR
MNRLEILIARIERSVQSPAYCIDRLFESNKITVRESRLLQAHFGLA